MTQKVENQPRFAELQYGITFNSLKDKKEIVVENQKKFLKTKLYLFVRNYHFFISFHFYYILCLS